MESNQPNQTNSGNQNASTSAQAMPNVLFREIHKNAWLKRHSSDRRTGFPRKSDRVWVVFCVHDDVEAYLEMYSDQKVALTHKPDWFAALNTTLHVSPSICGQDDEFEFAITLSSQVIRLAAPTWELMMEWVETIRNKLRELKVISPRENLYSKLPEQRLPLLPTRDPNSPLPLPPMGPSVLVPGVEPVHVDAAINNITDNLNSHTIQEHSVQETSRNHNDVSARSSAVGRSESVRMTQEVLNSPNIPEIVRNKRVAGSRGGGHARNVENTTESHQQQTEQVEFVMNRPRVRINRAVSVPDCPVPVCSVLVPEQNVTVIEVSNNSSRGSHSASEFGVFDFLPQEQDQTASETDEGDVFTTPPITPGLHKPFVNQDSYYEQVFVTTRTVTNTVTAGPSISQSQTSVSSPPPITANPADGIHVSQVNRNEVNGMEKSLHQVSIVSIPSCSHEPSTSGSVPVPGPNNNISIEVQSRLEKINSSGLIPRVQPKNRVHKNSVDATDTNSEKNVNKDDQNNPSKDKQDKIGLKSNNETSIVPPRPSQTSATNVIPVYSQVIKKDISVKQPTPSPRLSKKVLHPAPSSSNQPVEQVSTATIKPEVLPRTTSMKNQSADLSIVQPSSSSIQPLTNTPLQPERNDEQVKAESSSATPAASSSSHNKVESPLQRNKVLVNKINSPKTKPEPRVAPQPARPAPASTSSNSSNVPQDKKVVANCKAPKPNQNNPVHGNNSDVLSQNLQPVGSVNVQDIPLIGGHQRRRRRSSSSDTNAVPTTGLPSRAVTAADRIRVNVAPLNVAIPIQPEIVLSQRSQRNQSSVTARTESNNSVNVNLNEVSPRLTLREQQVMQLRKEMMHPGGVRLQLRRKDCMVSIALVDILGSVWIAGWKQRERPMLYNALHIGDQLVSVAEVAVHSAADAQKLIRSSSSLYIEFVIKRIPFGKVFALRRSTEGENLGIIQEGNTAEIKDIVVNSIAGRAGLSAKTQTSDGLSLTNWYLTEINGRPLNLFFKDNEIKDRLNAVGKEISILVQPHDFIKHLKKHLKNIRGYKDYIVQ